MRKLPLRCPPESFHIDTETTRLSWHPEMMYIVSFPYLSAITYLVGGLNPSEKYERQLG